MKTKRKYEAYVQIDHRNSPGITHEFVAAARANGLDVPIVGAGLNYESAVAVCHCCLRDIVLNPKRTRERAYCHKHDDYLCDFCAAMQKSGQDCIPFRKRFEVMVNKIINRTQIV